MATFVYKTRGGAKPNQKPRVYFSSHPDDFNKYFDDVCADIFKTHDCAIYYTEDMTSEISDEGYETELSGINLFVIPVTLKLLTEPNRAMDGDIQFAKRKNIPILPLMMEIGIDQYYSLPEKFGERQYISPHASDLTEISYADKLKKHLDSVLISDEQAKLIRTAFDAYIFLSYRKKDRKYANELMKLIHKNEEYRDIAIWYDEFLTPGESFNENIHKMLENSKIFTLLVTPNILEEPGGMPNFVMDKEYPIARDMGIEILPVEMESTDTQCLSEKFLGIPKCVSSYNDEEFRERLAETLLRYAKSEDEKSPEHTFLMGIAYLEGIDVEVERERGVKLIKVAANQGLYEAIEKLYVMYRTGIGVALDYKEALIWCERMYEHSKKHLGDTSPKALSNLNDLASTYLLIGDYARALEYSELLCSLTKEIYGEDNINTASARNTLTQILIKMGNYAKAAEMQKNIYQIYSKHYGDHHTLTMNMLANYAQALCELGKYKESSDLFEYAYSILKKSAGTSDSGTLSTLNNLAYAHTKLGNYRRALELREEAYDLLCKLSSERHPVSLVALDNLANAYAHIGLHERALELHERAYALHLEVLGANHPDTIITLTNFAMTYKNLGNNEKALELMTLSYSSSIEAFGEEHPHSLAALDNLASIYDNINDHRTAIALKEKAYSLWCKTLGEEHPDSLICLGNIAYSYGEVGEHLKAFELQQKQYEISKKVLGTYHPSTVCVLNNIAFTLHYLGDTKNAVTVMSLVVSLRTKILGEDHPDTRNSAHALEFLKGYLE